MDGALVTQNMEKSEVLSSTPQSLLARPPFRDPRSNRQGKKRWSKEDLTVVEDNQIREYLSNLDIHKCMGPVGIYP